jgi:16S rRNA (guanine527-N7)-methyltransferase
MKNINTEIEHYLSLLQQWNRVYNLTAIRDPEDMMLLHIEDSLAVNSYLHGNRIIDVGSGGGLPGIPLALSNPDKHFTLLDSNSKKTRFLTQVVLELKLKNVEVIHSRCEDFHPAIGFDSIISRAFASLQVMLTTTQHLLGKDGQFLAMKGIFPEQEMKEIPPGFTVLGVHRLQIKGLEAERCLVCVKKD